MLKRINLTWKNDEGLEIKEECFLLDEDSPLYFDGANGPVCVNGLGDVFAQEGMVLFEDDEGLFMLRPDQILNIEVIKW